MGSTRIHWRGSVGGSSSNPPGPLASGSVGQMRKTRCFILPKKEELEKRAFRYLRNEGLEDLITVVAKEKVLGEDAHEGKHGKASVLDLPVLVVDPALVRVIDPVGGSEDVSSLVPRAVLDLLGEPLDGAAPKDELEPSDRGELLGGLDRVVRQGRVEGGVDAAGVEVPSEARGHGDAAVLELGLAVEVHDVVGLAVGQAQGVEEADGGEDAYDGLILPRIDGGGGAGRGGGGGEGGTVSAQKGRQGDVSKQRGNGEQLRLYRAANVVSRRTPNAAAATQTRLSIGLARVIRHSCYHHT
eukprot:CAMPEP_0113527068 /NCGR_PEP_ID=MMETSP0015_2-20120614/1093_1 /TAXON_ID=2838 /ORGANISM="Odontella" /LENGTH=298 /DNA_ID=CAMNT_0000425467 /DNA_START=134 /DNA_END=1031 /DNA_ORIENTATION=- /assembly_acc=CAM_ASM_000160